MLALRLSFKRNVDMLKAGSKCSVRPSSTMKPMWLNQCSYYHVTILNNDWNLTPYGHDDNNSLIWNEYTASFVDFLQNGIWFAHRRAEGRRSWRKYLNKQGYLARIRTIAGRKILRRQIHKGRRVIGRPKN